MIAPRRVFQRLANAYRKYRAGLTLFGENITPETPNDLFQAHLSIYEFFSRYAKDQRVLDLGCGCGYGSKHLHRGAEEVLGVDLDRRNVEYASRLFQGPGLAFQVGDAESFRSEKTFDLVVSSNVFEHLEDVRRGLAVVMHALKSDGTFLLAVPPIYDQPSFDANAAIRYHRSNYYVTEWLEILRSRFETVKVFDHLPPVHADLDFSSPFPSTVSPLEFRFVERTDPIASSPTLTAIFVAQGAKEDTFVLAQK